MRTQYILLAVAVVFHYSHASAQWVRTNGPYGARVSSILVDGPRVFIGTGDDFGGYGGIFLSTNYGEVWTAVNSGIPTDLAP